MITMSTPLISNIKQQLIIIEHTQLIKSFPKPRADVMRNNIQRNNYFPPFVTAYLRPRE